MECTNSNPKRIHTDFQETEPFSFPQDVFEKILFATDERVIEKTKMTSHNLCNLLDSSRSFWLGRVTQETLHTTKDIIQTAKIIPNLRELALVHIREPRSWRIAALFTKLVSLKLVCELDPPVIQHKDLNYEDLKRYEGCLSNMQDPQNRQEIYETALQIATLTHLKNLEIYPGEFFLEHISLFSNLTNLERLSVRSKQPIVLPQVNSIHQQLMKFTNLTELNWGNYCGLGWESNVPDTMVFPFLQHFQLLKKLKLGFNEPFSDFKGLGQLTNLEELSLKISEKTQNVFDQIKFLTKLSKLHVISDVRITQIPSESFMNCIFNLQHLKEFHLKIEFIPEYEETLVNSLFSKLPNFEKLITGFDYRASYGKKGQYAEHTMLYEADASQPEGYRVTRLDGHYEGSLGQFKRPNNSTKQLDEVVTELFAQGASWNIITSEARMSKETCVRVFHLSEKDLLSERTINRIATMRRENLPWDEIAKKMHMTKSACFKIFKEHKK